jgi:predicted transcriptional regulator
MWSDDPKEATKQLKDELEKLLVLGYAQIVGVNKKGDDLYMLTEAGMDYLERMRDVTSELFPDEDDLI